MPPTTLPASVAPPAMACRVAFNARAAGIHATPGSAVLHVPVPVLAGKETELLLDRCAEPQQREGCTVFPAHGRQAGFVIADPALELEAATRDVYRRIFAATAGLQLYRIWNYVPHINGIIEGLEAYQRFCRGRSHAFENRFGRGFQRQLPAGSAVGVSAGPLAVAFLAGLPPAQHFENPQQIPAFEYPPLYGPRPPSFSRATLVSSAARRELFISGTAAIRGHATVAADDLAGQLACTRENLHLIAATAGAGSHFGAAQGWTREVKVYLRQARDLPQIRADLEQHLLRDVDSVVYLHADLCRADLLVEIEAVLTKGV